MNAITPYIPAHIINRVMAVHPPTIGESDHLCWDLPPSGKFSLSSKFSFLAGHDMEEEQQSIEFNWKSIWHGKGPPCIKTFLGRWLMVRFLPTHKGVGVTWLLLTFVKSALPILRPFFIKSEIVPNLGKSGQNSSLLKCVLISLTWSFVIGY